MTEYNIEDAIKATEIFVALCSVDLPTEKQAISQEEREANTIYQHAKEAQEAGFAACKRVFDSLK